MTSPAELAKRLRLIALSPEATGYEKENDLKALRAAADMLEQIAGADASMPRRALGMFRNAPALFLQPDGKYVLHADALAAITDLQAQLLAAQARSASLECDYKTLDALCSRQGISLMEVEAQLLAAQADAARWRCLMSMHYPNGPLMIADHSGTWGGLASWAGDDPVGTIDAQLSTSETKP
jgi:hypothetical protein